MMMVDDQQQYFIPVKVNLPLYTKHALIASELLCPGSFPLLHNLLLMHTRVRFVLDDVVIGDEGDDGGNDNGQDTKESIYTNTEKTKIMMNNKYGETVSAHTNPVNYHTIKYVSHPH